ncbi:ABC transporter substrate-binding protein [Paenibacillus aceris]|uniref:Peptide/nickel transport system substrate-binding protein n=1 Tax=Paenibacillus aceris TaxID=869555 RepID=A0ABS4I2E3_9BACL|nr:ABC transporter substrate-binding protein [Paenibacillus aceris]MBP1964980.1 peptide/nickel transport system substrate-binding protein [Paenibacillus aceris]NHW35641.1 ABC transporter substrate-binding protein [Paenibacillus aceris]
MKWGTRKTSTILFTTLALFAGVLSGCSDSTPQAQTGVDNKGGVTEAAKPSEPAKKGESVIYHLGETVNPEQVTNFNPFLATGNWQPFFDYVFDPLYYFNPVKGQLVPRLAVGDGTWSDDNKTYTVKLNMKAKWQDGKAFTVDDVLYSFLTLKNNKVLDRYQLWGDGRLQEVTAQGSDTVVFKLSKQFPSLPFYLTTVYIAPKQQFEKEDPSQFLNKTPIGTGPFKFKSINESAIVLDKNADYFLGAPNIDQLFVNRFNNSSTLTLALEKGDVQGSTGTVAMPSVPKLLENPVNKLQVYPGLNTFSVIINNEKPGLTDAAVRRAIQLALDRKSLIEKGESNGVFPANPGFLSSVFGEMVDSKLVDSQAYAYNVNEANKLLESAGYKKNAKGIYEKDGKPLSFTYHMAANAPAQNKEGAMITDWLKSIGIETSVKLVTWPELTKLLMSGDYDLLQNGIQTPPDPQAMLEIFHSKMTAPTKTNAPGLNYMRFRDADVDKWLDEASSADTGKRKELYQQVQNRIAEKAPLAVMYNVGGHIPYRVDQFTNYNEDLPVTSALSLLQIKKK